jgi:hypothetical protein
MWSGISMSRSAIDCRKVDCRESGRAPRRQQLAFVRQRRKQGRPFRSRSLRGDRTAGRSCDDGEGCADQPRIMATTKAAEADALEGDVGVLDQDTAVERERVRVDPDVATLGVRGKHTSGGPAEWSPERCQCRRSCTARSTEGQTHRSVAAFSLAIESEAERSSVDSLADRLVSGVEVVDWEGVVVDEPLPSLAAPLAAWERSSRE